MTAKDRAFLNRMKRRAARLEPPLRRAYERMLDDLAASIPPGRLEQFIRDGNIERIVEQYTENLTTEAKPFERAMTDAVRQATEAMAREIPPAALRLAKDGIRFDYLNPRVIDAVRQLDDRMMRTLADGVRETVRTQVETGLSQGLSPRTVARHLDLRLAPNQAQAIANYRRALESGDVAKALSYKLRDARFDKAVSSGKALSREQVDKMVQAYSRRMHAFNAETNARTAALDSLKLGQRLSIEDAIEKGVYERNKMYKRWVAVGGPEGDGRNRPEHLAMHGEIAPFDGPFSNGEEIPGSDSWNCRCEAVYFEEDNPERIARAEAERIQAAAEGVA